MIGTALTKDPRLEIPVPESRRLLLAKGERQLSFDSKPRKIVKAVVAVEKERQRENFKMSTHHGNKGRNHPRV